MKVLKMEDNDLEMKDGDFVWTNDDLLHSANILFKSGKGEWFFNREMGTDYSRILGKTTDEQIRTTIVNTLAQEPDVRIVEQIEIQRAGRSAAIGFRAVTNEGERSVNGVTISVG